MRILTKALILLIASITLISSACVVYISEQQLSTVDFNYSIFGNNVLFYDNSTSQPIKWYWDFGDQNISTEQNPIHTYVLFNNQSYAYVYQVTLTVTFDNNKQISITKSIQINNSATD